MKRGSVAYRYSLEPALWSFGRRELDSNSKSIIWVCQGACGAASWQQTGSRAKWGQTSRP
jgi:hypothetical protein